MHELHELHEHVNFTQIVSNNLQIISNHLKSRHVWKCQNMFTCTSHDISKFSKRCLQRRDAARCRVASFSLRCLRLSKRLSEKTCFYRTDAFWGWSSCANGRLERRWHTSKYIQIMLKCQLIELCVLFFKLWIMCAFTWYKIVLDIFFISPKESKLKAVAHLSSLSSLHGAIPRRPRRRRPSTAELLEGSTTPIHPRRFSPWTAYSAAGEAEAGLRSLGWRWPSWTFHQGIFWFGQGLKRGFSFCFPVLLDDFGRTNAHLFKRMNVGHGWTPMCKIVTMKLGQINDMPMKRCISMHLGDPHPRSCSQSFPGWNWQPTKTTEFILIC